MKTVYWILLFCGVWAFGVVVSVCMNKAPTPEGQIPPDPGMAGIPEYHSLIDNPKELAGAQTICGGQKYIKESVVDATCEAVRKAVQCGAWRSYQKSSGYVLAEPNEHCPSL